MQVELPGRSEMITDVIDRVHVSLEQLLALHDLSLVKDLVRREVMWEPVIATLVGIHTTELQAWRDWCTQQLRRKENPAKFANTHGDRKHQYRKFTGATPASLEYHVSRSRLSHYF